MKFAHHLGLKGVILNIPKELEHRQLVYLANLLKSIKNIIKVYLRVELNQKQLEILDTINIIYGYDNPLLAVLLQVGLDLEQGYSKLFDRFLAQNLEIVEFNTAHFINN